MVRMLIELNQELYDALTKLVSSGRYRDLDQAIEVSALNQLRLESGKTGALEGRVSRKHLGEPKANNIKGQAVSVTDKTLKLLEIPRRTPETLNSPGPTELLFAAYEAEDQMFLWGQYNRILPGKIGLRVLDNMVSNEAGTTAVPYEEFRKLAANAARQVGLGMKAEDDRLGRKRSSRFSNALPIGDDEQKTLSRYKNHFLGRKRKADGILDGFLGRLKFINTRTEDGIVCVGLTPAGLSFSRKPNDLLLGREAAWPLSDEDIAFYGEHVLKNVPEELQALTEVLTHIIEGASETSQIDELLARESRVHEWTGAMVITNRAGTLSRLWELKLLTRSPDKAAKYVVTESGRLFLDKANRTAA